MFDGKPLNELHEQSSRQREEEEMMRSRRSSGESDRSEMGRGRRRDRS